MIKETTAYKIEGEDSLYSTREVAEVHALARKLCRDDFIFSYPRYGDTVQVLLNLMEAGYKVVKNDK